MVRVNVVSSLLAVALVLAVPAPADVLIDMPPPVLHDGSGDESTYLQHRNGTGAPGVFALERYAAARVWPVRTAPLVPIYGYRYAGPYPAAFWGGCWGYPFVLPWFGLHRHVFFPHGHFTHHRGGGGVRPAFPTRPVRTTTSSFRRGPAR